MNFWKYCIAVLGAFQYGYTIAVMAGALLFLAPLYGLDLAQQGFLVSTVLMGALVGAAFSGMLAEGWGRKRAQIVIAGLFLIGTLGVACAFSLGAIIVGRIIQGIAVGAISVVGPMYIAEVSPVSTRGQNISFYQLAVTVGILCAYGASYVFAGEGAWRWMFAIGTLPAILQGVGFLFLPDTQSKNSHEPSSWRAVFKPELRTRLASAILINLFQQVTGINAIIYFAPSIFELCGFKSAASAIFSAVLLGGVNVLSTFISIFLIDHKGRKPLLLVGLGGMVVSLIALAFSCFSAHSGTSAALAVGSLMTYIGCFAFGLGPIPQLITSEMFSNATRSRGVTLAMMTNWLCNFLVVFTFMDLVTYVKASGAFLIYAALGVVAFYFVWKKIPETKGTILK
jgi:SP family galactose:H+ symporter-like MFS transporter